jgi:FtsP/CotA-like multicopper oxidase with cupredoxin domain
VHAVLIGVAIPLILTATIFAVPSSISVNDHAHVTDSSGALGQETTTAIALPVAQAVSGKTHHIVLSANELDSGLLAYKMVSHEVNGKGKKVDLTSKYPDSPTIPGPTIVLNEGDEVFLTLQNKLGSGKVSVHPHGVHYDIISDGTLKAINDVKDEAATTKKDYKYHWIAGPGTAGSWPYHDHTFITLNGAENRGLFGTIIVNPASGEVEANDGKTVPLSEISKNIVLYLGDDAFWGTEIQNDGEQVALWTNPQLRAHKGDYVRFHLIALGTDLHEFEFDGYEFIDPATSDLVSSKAIGPLENLQFTLLANKDGTYRDLQTSNALMGVEGTFDVVGKGQDSDSIPSAEPEAF